MEPILLQRHWPGSFSRSVRDDKGAILTTLTFTPGDPQWLDGPELAAVRGDIGKALCYAELGPNGDPLGKPAKIQEPGGLDRLTGDGKAEPPAVESAPVSGPNGDPEQNGEAKGRKPKR
jgi:hypothetical protein